MKACMPVCDVQANETSTVTAFVAKIETTLQS